MRASPSDPPFPTSTGRWIAAFRYRLRINGRPVSPETLGPLIDRSGATIRRWESGRAVPDEAEITRLAEVCGLTPLQVAFLSAACTRTPATLPPPREDFEAHMRRILAETPYPAMVVDSLYYVRAWNSHVDALAPGLFRTLRRGLHAVALLLRAPADALALPERRDGEVRDGVRLFWMATAAHGHRPEYRSLIEELAREPGFREMWLELALGDGRSLLEPISATHAIGGSGAAFRIYSRTVVFPPTYQLNEYHPDEPAAQERLEALQEAGPPAVLFLKELHWVKEPPAACG